MPQTEPPVPPEPTPASEREVLSFPAALAQQVFSFLHQLEPGNPAFNVAVRFHLAGPLNLAVLEQTFNEMIRRHEVLRTSLEEENGELMQIVLPVATVKIETIDISHLPEAERRAETERQGTIEAEKQFDFTIAPLCRINVVRLGPEEHMLQVTIHHAISDGWSIGLMIEELSVIYAALSKGEPSPLPPLPLQFADFTIWQHKYFEGPEIAAQLEYWKRRLAGYVELNVPTDRPRPLVKSWKGDIVSILLPTELTDRLKRISQQNEASLFMVFLTALKVMLMRNSGQSDIALGVPIVGRTRTETEKLIGVFINTVILRSDLSGNPSFHQALQRVRDTVLEALANQDLPYELLVKELHPGRTLSRNPLIQVNFTYQRDFVKPTSFAGITLTAIPSRSPGAIFDLHFFTVERDGVWRASCDFSTDLYDRETTLRMLEHFRSLLESAAAVPETPIAELDMLPAPERQRMLVEWNLTQRDYPHDKTIHELFEEQATRHPAKVAVRCGEESLTYAELDLAADRLCAQLQSLGVKVGMLVGLCVERSTAMLVGLMGIMKSGAAYVPMDPAFPKDRLRFMVEDTAMPVIVTQASLVPMLPPHQAKILLLDARQPQVPAGFVKPQVGAEALAYVIFTSGSTGRPKGVQIGHRAVVNFLNAMRREPGLTSQDVLLAVTTLSFDIAGLELHLPLTTGATIVLAPWEVAADGEALLREIERRGVTVLQATPATWRLMLAAEWKGTPSLKALCGGEALPADLAAELIPRCAELWNMYGPTETTIWSTCARVTSAQALHIGRPIDNTEIYILDTENHPVPIGLPGELFIGGDGLARGYLNRPDLTAERFVPHPFKPGERLYRTGDLARYRNDGTIDCLGRLDFQIKIRGFRIELGEIETQLVSHPEVKHAVIMAREDSPGDKRLVAYYVARSDPPPATNSLRDHLHHRLPDYMVPATFVCLPALPLTPNGKIDRQALPAPASSVVGTSSDAIAPRSDDEKRLAVIFESVLGTKIASVRDNFFDLGGHSLLAVKLMRAIERDFGTRLPLARLFEAPTVEKLAAVVAQHHDSGALWNSLVPIAPQRHKPALFLVHGAGGNVLLYRDIAKAIGPDVSLHGFQSQGLDFKSRPLTSVEAMAERYVRELRAFQPSGPYNLGGYCMGGSIVYEMARLLRKQGQHVGLVALLDTYNFSMVKNNRRRISVYRQKIGFHIDNLTHLGAKNLFSYFTTKLRMAEKEGADKIAACLQSLKNALTGAAEEAGAEVFIQEINHQAGWEFVPQPLDTAITVFSPRKNYDFFPDPKMGWYETVGDRLEVVKLPVNPHAMLIEPCAGMLANELKKRLLLPAGTPRA